MKFTLALIVFLALFLRVWNLGGNPPSLTWDEVAWGYNAYSLGIDGRDEFDRSLPYDYLESFGDFKPPVYAYLAILPVKLLGLNEFAVRLPSALLGTLTVLLTYFLVKKIFMQTQINTSTLALLSSLILAISPWHINLSRAAFEANVASFFIVLGVFLFMRSVSQSAASFPLRKWNSIDTLGLAFSMFSFVFSMYTFNTARVVAPLLVLILIVGFRKRLMQMKKEVVIAIIIGIITIAPIAQFLTTPQASLRFKEVNIFSDASVIERTNIERQNAGNIWWASVVYNRRFAYAVEYIKHYLDNLNPSFLFIRGDGNPKFSTQEIGQFYLLDLPFLILGTLFLFRKKEGYWWLLPVWFVLGIVPAATARETPHALRIETVLPTVQIVIAYGIVQSFFVLGSKRLKEIALILFIIAGALNVSYYVNDYHRYYPLRYSGEWQYGYKDAIEYVNSVESEYDGIYITETLGRPYIYTLFYTQYDPKIFRKQAIVKREAFGFVHVEGFGKYKFAKNIRELPIETGQKALFVDVPSSVPDSAIKKKTFYLLNGAPALIAYTL